MKSPKQEDLELIQENEKRLVELTNKVDQLAEKLEQKKAGIKLRKFHMRRLTSRFS